MSANGSAGGRRDPDKLERCREQIATLLDHCDDVGSALDAIGEELTGAGQPVDRSTGSLEGLVEKTENVGEGTIDAIERELSDLLGDDPPGDAGDSELTDQPEGDMAASHDRLIDAVREIVDKLADEDELDVEHLLAHVETAQRSLRHLESSALQLESLLERWPEASDRRSRGEQSANVVAGQITHDGDPQPGLTVVAYDRNLRGHAELGRDRSDGDGEYHIKYGSDASEAHEYDAADLVIRVRNDIGERLGSSDVLYNAEPEERIDLDLPPEVSVEPSEYARLRDEIDAIRGDVELASLTESDIAFITRELDIAGDDRYPAGEETVDTLLKAVKASERVSARPSILYGLARQNVSIDPESLAEADPSALIEAHRSAVQSGIVRPQDDAESELRALHQRATRTLDRTDWSLRVATFVVTDTDGGPRQGARLTVTDPTTGRRIGRATSGGDGRAHVQVSMPPSEKASRDLLVTVENDVSEVIASERASVTAGTETTIAVTESTGTIDTVPISTLGSVEELALSDDTLTSLGGTTLSAIRSAGGLDGLDEDIDITPSEKRLVDDLSRLSVTTDLATAADLSANGYGDPVEIADTDRATFVAAVGDTVDRTTAIEVHEIAQVQSALLASIVTERRTAIANGTDVPEFSIGGDA